MIEPRPGRTTIKTYQYTVSGEDLNASRQGPRRIPCVFWKKNAPADPIGSADALDVWWQADSSAVLDGLSMWYEIEHGCVFVGHSTRTVDVLLRLSVDPGTNQTIASFLWRSIDPNC